MSILAFALGTAPYLGLLVIAIAAMILTVSWWRWRSGVRAAFRGSDGARIGLFVAPMLVVAALATTAFAAARPQFGSTESSRPQRGIEAVFVLDVSNSMSATDASPTRLGVAQREINSLLERMPGHHAGLVVFAGEPFVRAPLTSDLRALSQIVNSAESERGIVEPGSDVGAAVRAAVAMLGRGRAESRAIIVVSDGEDRAGDAATAIADARGAGARVYTAGVGSTEGAAVVDIDRDSGEARPRVGTDGTAVVTRLNEESLREIASEGGGRYIRLDGADSALAGLAAEFNALPSTLFEAPAAPTPIERFQIVGAIALALLAIELVIPMLRAGAGSLRIGRLWPPVLGSVFVAAICSTSVAEINDHGNRAYDAADFEAAAGQYKTAQARAPQLDELHHNAGNAYDRMGRYDEAIDETSRALPTTDDLVSIIEYALGNHYAGASRLSEAIEAYKRSLLAQPGDLDAKHNLEAITARLSATPTATPPLQAEGTPTPGGSDGEPGEPNPDGTPGAGTPGPHGEATPSNESDRELRRTLEEALAGIDDDVTREEAERLLDLLREQNRRAIEDLQGGDSIGLPDY